MKRNLSLPIVLLLLLAVSCGSSSFASQLKVALATSGPLVESLNLGDKKAVVLTDFADLATAAGHLADDLKVCDKSKQCGLDVVSVFEVRYWDILRRGHFKLSPKLEKVQAVLSSIIAAAKVYYGVQTVRTAGTAGTADTDLKARLDELRTAMKP